jgi:hypothetical protein
MPEWWESAPVVRPSPRASSGDNWWEAAPIVKRPEGLHAALAGAQQIGPTPWHSQGMFGGRGPSVRDVLDTLPAAGGILGGVLGAPSGPAAVGASALGGAAGEAFKQLAERAIGVKAPESGTEAAAGIATEAVLQGAGEGVGRLMPLAGKALRGAAEVQYGRALNATTKPLKAESRKIVPQLLDRNVQGSLGGLAEKGAEASAETGRRIAKTYEKASDAGVKSHTAPIIKDLEAAKQRFFARGDAGQAINTNPGAVAKLEAMQELIGQFGETARPDQLWLMRKSLDDIIKAGGGFGGELTPGTTKALQREARTALQKELNKASPDITKLNAEFSLWKGLENVSKATIERKTGQSGIVEAGLRSGVGGMAGLLVGDDPAWGSVGALLALATKSPRYRTFSAVNKARLAHALSKGQVATATSILAKLLGSAATAQPRGEPTSEPYGSPEP